MKHSDQPMIFSSDEIISKYIERERLDIYLNLVRGGSGRFNLHSGSLTDNDMAALVAESLLPLHLEWISLDSDSILDIGSGWGIPAIPLLLANNQAKITLLERSKKKSSFLALAMNSLGISGRVVAEDLHDFIPAEKFQVIICRQISIDDHIVRSIIPLVSPAAHLITYGPDFPRLLEPKTETLLYILDDRPTRLINRTKIS